MSVATIVITATRANAPATTIINRGPTGPAGPAGPAGADSITSATTSDGTADINFNQVGIGTTSPSTALEVGGTIKASTHADAIVIGSPTTVKWKMGAYGGNDLLIRDPNNNTKLSILSGGNVGIGTASPSSLLHAYQTISTAPSIVSRVPFKTNADAQLKQRAALRIDINEGSSSLSIGGTGSTNSGFIQSYSTDSTSNYRNFVLNPFGGNVGIGTASPSAALEVVGGIKLSDNSPLTWATSSTRIFGQSGYMQLQVAASDVMRLTSSGNVGIGTTSPSQKLDVDGAVKKAVFTVNTLPTATAGTSCYVSDSNHTHHSNVGQVVASGGSNFVPVYYDGTDWRIG